jgi:galactoside O-acetyltransferase
MDDLAASLKFARIGKDVMIWPQAKVVSPETIMLGDSIIIDDFAFIMGGKKSVIGSFVHIASFASILGGGELIMEDFAGLSSGGRIYTGNDDYLGGSLTGPTVPYPYRMVTRSFVHIKKHVIVGANSVILPGVTIGEGAAIGANSLITKDCQPWTIYFGSPARAIKPRRREKILELESQLRAAFYDDMGMYIPKRNR